MGSGSGADYNNDDNNKWGFITRSTSAITGLPFFVQCISLSRENGMDSKCAT
jgi:hypothetical protein